MCVYIKHRAQKPSFPEAKALHRAVWHSRPRRASHHYVHTGPDSHTRTQPVRPDSPEAPLLLFPQPRSRRALDYLGLFRHRHMKLRQPSSQKKKKKKKPVCILPLTHPQHVLNWTSSSYDVPSGGVSPPAVGGRRSLLEVRSPGWLSPSAWRVWLVLWGVESGSFPGLPRTPSVGARHPAQTDAGWAVRPPGREASRGARDASAQEQPVLARPVPPPPTWTWKCRLTVRMGRAAWSLPWWDIQADLAWGHRREEPINDKTWVTNQQQEFDEGRPSTRIWGVLRGGTAHSPSCFPSSPSAHPKHH